jgi:hypothetical protein
MLIDQRGHRYARPGPGGRDTGDEKIMTETLIENRTSLTGVELAKN